MVQPLPLQSLVRIDSTARAAVALATAGILLVSTIPIYAQLPTASLSSIYPAGGKQGTSVEVTASGSDLDDATQLLCSHPGITAAQKISEPNEFQKTARPVPNQFIISIGADVPLGTYDVRLGGRFGVSNPRAFVVSNHDEILDDGNNKQIDRAREVTAGVLINGRIDGGSVDYYKLSLKQGQRILIDCRAQRIDSRLDGTLIVCNASGSELARNRDTEGLDPVIDFTAPADGQYVIGLYDFVYAGGADYFYRLAIHSGPQVDFIFPPSGLPGSDGPYTVYGRMLPGGQVVGDLTIEGSPLEKVTVNIALPGDEATVRQLDVVSRVMPQAALLDGIPYRLDSSNPTTLYFARAPVVAEQEPNNTPAQVQNISIPCECVGQFYPARDYDWFQFSAKKGETFMIETIAHRMGLDCDPILLLQKVTKSSNGEEVVSEIAQVDDPADRANRIGMDFDTSTDDPDYRFTAPEDATYRICLRDQFGTSRHDPRYVYRLLIRQAQPDFRLVAVPQPVQAPVNQNVVAAGSPALRRGGTALFTIRVERRDGFHGEIQIAAEGLPQGVTCPGAVIGGNVDSCALIFVADTSAAAWSGSIRIIGKAEIDGAEVVRYARGGAVVWGTTNRQQQLPEFRVTQDIALAVLDRELEPALVQAGDDRIWETARGGKLEIPVKVTRHDGFNGELNLVCTDLPNELKMPNVSVKGSDTEAKLAFAVTNASAKPGTYTFYLRADTKIKHGRNPDATAAAQQEQQELDAVVKELAEKAKQSPDEKDLAATLKTAQQLKQAADKRLDEVKKANTPKDINIAVISTPIRVRIADSPIKLSVQPLGGTVQQGQQLEIPVTIERLYGFSESVEITFEPPSGIGGLSAAKITLPKDQTQSKLVVATNNSTPPGDHSVTIRARTKFNNVNADNIVQTVVKVEKAQLAAK